MGLSDTYWLKNEVLPEYSSDTCVELEFGKVRSIALIKRYFFNTTLAGDIENLTLWQQGIQDGAIIVMPNVSGAFDPGDPKAYKGYGRRSVTRGPREQKLTFSDPSYILNYDFYNSLHKRTDWIPVFRTSRSLHIGKAAADLYAVNVVEEDLEAEVVWKVEAMIRHIDLPIRVDADFLAPLINQSSSTIVVSGGSGGGGSTIINAFTKIAKFRVGSPGAPMADQDDTYTNSAMEGKRIFVWESGVKLTVDDGTGDISFDPAERYVSKPIASNTLQFINGPVFDKSILEFYAY